MIKLRSWLISAWNAKVSTSPILNWRRICSHAWVTFFASFFFFYLRSNLERHQCTPWILILHLEIASDEDDGGVTFNCSGLYVVMYAWTLPAACMHKTGHLASRVASFSSLGLVFLRSSAQCLRSEDETPVGKSSREGFTGQRIWHQAENQSGLRARNDRNHSMEGSEWKLDSKILKSAVKE